MSTSPLDLNTPLPRTYPFEDQKLLAQARQAHAEAALSDTARQTAEVVLRQVQREELDRNTADIEHGFFHFLGEVETKNVLTLIGRLNRWSRQNPGAPLTLSISTYGGNTVDGFMLYDRIRELSAAGHHVTTKAAGVCASMGVVLWAAGDTVQTYPNTLFLIHQPLFQAGGSLGAVEDAVSLGAKLYDQILAVLSGVSGQSIAKLKKLVGRSDHWIFAQEIVALGFGEIIGADA